ncbi:MAG: response regulator [Acidobacteriia bacterium]|nr:response regulator [Terriglobia bacterium]
MRVLIAEDDAISRRVLEVFLRRWGYEVEPVENGDAAWERLQREDAPSLAILDWMMPGMGGVEICRRVRELGRPTYVILLTARTGSEDIVEGLEAGADDYVTKPFNREELRARVQGGRRIVELQRSLAERVKELEQALARVKQLQGLLPICSYCKKIRDDGNYWRQVEAYITEHSEAVFSHGICPECFDKFVKPELNKMNGSGGTP